MDIVVGAIVNGLLLVALIGSLAIWARKREKKMTKEAFTVRKPMLPAYIGTFLIVFFGFLLFVLLIGPGEDIDGITLLVLGTFLLVGILMLVDTLYWKVSVDKNRIAYRALFGKSALAEFGDITYAKKRGITISVYSGNGKLFSAAITYTGYKILIGKLEQENIVIEDQGFL